VKISLINHSDINGGAARAAYRIHQALLRQGLDSRMYVNEASSGDWSVEGPASTLEKTIAMLRAPVGGLFSRLLATECPVLHSPAILPSCRVKRINVSNADIVHLHWVHNELLSIRNLGCIRKALVWTLHDMWAFCGAEHYTENFRWRDGYTRHNRPSYERGLDLNRWTWWRKSKLWQRPLHIVTPSHWLADCVRQSVLMHNWPVTVIPNPIDTDMWKPRDKALARQLLNLPSDVPLLLFGAIGGTKDPRKGFDLLKSALGNLRGQIPGLELVVFGQMAPKETADLAFPVHYTGHLLDDVSLVLLYSAADATVIPSRQDNLPNTGIESFACGTPVVAFDVCGLPDIVEHQQTGYLAKAFDAIDLAKGLKWLLEDSDRRALLGKAARACALQRWSYEVVAPQYLDVYQRVIEFGKTA
jgi:glycosyltransferase involved in cell wall biosynthesis